MFCETGSHFALQDLGFSHVFRTLAFASARFWCERFEDWTPKHETQAKIHFESNLQVISVPFCYTSFVPCFFAEILWHLGPTQGGHLVSAKPRGLWYLSPPWRMGHRDGICQRWLAWHGTQKWTRYSPVWPKTTKFAFEFDGFFLRPFVDEKTPEPTRSRLWLVLCRATN